MSQEQKKKGCRSTLWTFIQIVLGSFTGVILTNFLMSQCQQPQFSDYLEHLDRQENNR